jgi:hypothetical protein
VNWLAIPDGKVTARPVAWAGAAVPTMAAAVSKLDNKMASGFLNTLLLRRVSSMVLTVTHQENASKGTFGQPHTF